MLGTYDILETIAAKHHIPAIPTCRCCGKNLGLERFMDNHPIHTRCIPKHWGKHFKGTNANRCKEFSQS